MISLRDVVTGFGNRDPLAEVWRRSLRGGGGGSTVITGVPPLRYIGDGRPLTDYLISGNTVQDGTPSAEAPVDATGSGVRTGNLFDHITMSDGVSGHFLDENGVEQAFAAWEISAYIPCNGSEFTIGKIGGVAPSICLYDKDKNFIAGKSYNTGGANNKTYVTITSFVTAFYIRFSWYMRSDLPSIMLNLGSTALPYEPYGYKLPLTVNGAEYPIFLGQVESTRRVKKLVLTGDDGTWQKSNTRTGSFFLRLGNVAIPGFGLCDRAVNAQNAGEYSSSGKMLIERSGSNILINMWLFDTDISVDDFKSYLASQYAAGTPVTVWYVLAEPETAVVNEPLMKIGDYADTISAAQAGVTIPTANGANVLDVPTEVPPSEIAIKGGIRSV